MGEQTPTLADLYIRDSELYIIGNQQPLQFMSKMTLNLALLLAIMGDWSTPPPPPLVDATVYLPWNIFNIHG